mgnify:CR=1 FL=1|jgi:hypothetical protein
MSNFTTVELDQLTAVSGGTSVEAGIQTKVASGNVKVDTATPPNPQATDSSAYLRCLDLVGNQAGMMESADNVARRQEKLCGPLLGQ